MVQTRTILGVGTVFAAGALAMTQMGFQQQDRQYKKTLAYMHDGRSKIQTRMDSMANTVSSKVDTVSSKVSDTVNGKK